jgi:UDP-3-O-[3-hydroxymyristoyl] glucosamine N-acyltransferase LpxD
MSESRFRALSELWPSPVDLIAELRKASFIVDEARFAFSQKLTSAAWASVRIPRSAKSETPGPGAFTYLGKNASLIATDWALVLVDARRPENALPFPALAVSYPDAAIDFILRRITPEEWTGASAPVPPDVRAEPGVHLGPGVHIGAGTILESGVRIGRNVSIGARCRIGAGSRIADDTVIGDDCQFTGPVSLGGQGFGFVEYPGQGRRQPRCHVGRVCLGDRVRLGAFVAIDRGVFEDTVIGDGTALDNLVQVGHNVRIGRDGILCGLVGISGSTEIGDRVTIAGLSGTKDHVRIGNDVTIAAQSGVNCDIEKGQTVKGYPPRPLAEALKLQVLTGRLPELFRRLKNLEDKKT